MKPHQPATPAEFMEALHSLRDSMVRPEIAIEEIPAPHAIAPFAVAVGGELSDGSLLAETANTLDPSSASSADEPPVTGKFILLYDPEPPAAWESCFRIVVLVRAHIDQDMGSDPLLNQVAWSWLNEAFEYCGTQQHNLGATFTRVVSESFGAIEANRHHALIEIRASWSPGASQNTKGIDLDFGSHLSAWSNLMCAAVGLPAVAQGFPALHGARGPRNVSQSVPT